MIGKDSSFYSIDGDRLLFPCGVYVERPAILNAGEHSLGGLWTTLNARHRIDMAQDGSYGRCFGLRGQVDSRPLAKVVDSR